MRQRCETKTKNNKTNRIIRLRRVFDIFQDQTTEIDAMSVLSHSRLLCRCTNFRVNLFALGLIKCAQHTAAKSSVCVRARSLAGDGGDTNFGTQEEVARIKRITKKPNFITWPFFDAAHVLLRRRRSAICTGRGHNREICLCYYTAITHVDNATKETQSPNYITAHSSWFAGEKNWFPK